MSQLASTSGSEIEPTSRPGLDRRCADADEAALRDADSSDALTVDFAARGAAPAESKNMNQSDAVRSSPGRLWTV